MNTFQKDEKLREYRQTSVLWPPLGPPKSGCCREVVAIQRVINFLSLNLPIASVHWGFRLVIVGRWSLFRGDC